MTMMERDTTLSLYRSDPGSRLVNYMRRLRYLSKLGIQRSRGADNLCRFQRKTTTIIRVIYHLEGAMNALVCRNSGVLASNTAYAALTWNALIGLVNARPRGNETVSIL